MRIIFNLAVIVSISSIAAGCLDRDTTPTPRPAVTRCAVQSSACAAAQRADLPTPEPVDPEALAILRKDPTVTILLGAMSAGTDYWLGFNERSTKNERGETLATVTIVFRDEFHFAGSVPRFSDPCSGVGDESVPEEHPCRKEPRTYRMEAVNWPGGSHLLDATIDLDRRAVVDLFNPGSSGDLEIEYYREHYDGSY